MRVDADLLKKETLDAVIQSFVLREGTDYGHQDFSLEQKVKQVRAQLIRGDVWLTFCERSQTVSIESQETAETTKKGSRSDDFVPNDEELIKNDF